MSTLHDSEMENDQIEIQKLANQIITEWFGPIDKWGGVRENYVLRWFKKDPEFDQKLKDKYEDTIREVIFKPLERGPWLQSIYGRLSLILLTDQFTRNIYRGSGDMFMGDALALTTARNTLADAALREKFYIPLPLILRSFYLLPLEHSESYKDQEQCLAESDALIQETRDRLQQAQTLLQQQQSSSSSSTSTSSSSTSTESTVQQNSAEEQEQSEAASAVASITGQLGYLESFRQFAQMHADIVLKFQRFPHRNKVLGRPSSKAEIEFLLLPGSSF